MGLHIKNLGKNTKYVSGLIGLRDPHLTFIDQFHTFTFEFLIEIA
jgi:hypothetical protein